MSSKVIKVENLSKKYTLSHQSQERYTALRDVIARRAKKNINKLFAPFIKPAVSSTDSTTEAFYALNNVSFELEQGDRVGIIGRNGAGKSTLLKILSRITEPTTGKIEITGRVASLLEVGTGFHPELTGRENIYLNGAILGMGKNEIRKKFDEIVEFAEVERFLDTPVKRYSSGMYVRLAFAVAAHLEPEILIVDEVLAVGDVQFQKKCLGRLEDVGKSGRTVLFVSHNMNAMSTLCTKGILLHEGKVEFNGDISSTINRYLIHGTESEYQRKKQPSKDSPYISTAWLEDIKQNKTSQFESGSPVVLVIETENPSGDKFEVAVSFWDYLRRPLWNFCHEMHGYEPVAGGVRVQTRITFFPPMLTVPEVIIDLAICPRSDLPYVDHIISAIKFTIIEKKDETLKKRWPEWPIFCPTQIEHNILS